MMIRTVPVTERLDPRESRRDIALDEEVSHLVGRIETRIYHESDNPFARGTCLKCHLTAGGRRVEIPKIPTVWFEHAKFSHTGHRAINCSQCHAGKFDPPKSGAPDEMCTYSPSTNHTQCTPRDCGPRSIRSPCHRVTAPSQHAVARVAPSGENATPKMRSL